MPPKNIYAQAYYVYSAYSDYKLVHRPHMDEGKRALPLVQRLL